MCHVTLFPFIILLENTLTSALSSSSIDTEITEGERKLLPDHVLPHSYHILLEPSWDDFTFSGTETIDISIVRATKEIVFHAYQIQIDECSLHFPSSTVPLVLFPEAIEYNEVDKTVRLQFATELHGEAKLQISFSGFINDQMTGFYRSQYKNSKGENSHLLTTQMEPTDARRVFPCWDEPARKATFTISLRVPDSICALSNMPIKSEGKVSKGVKQVNFDVSPLMSTYLVAFSLGEFEYLEKSASNVTIRVYTPPGKKEQGNFALDVAANCLQFYNDYFDISYPLPKLDLIAIPDFAAGAMENWGLITFRENALLIDNQSSGISSRQRVAYVIAHEIAHQVSSIDKEVKILTKLCCSGSGI